MFSNFLIKFLIFFQTLGDYQVLFDWTNRLRIPFAHLTLLNDLIDSQFQQHLDQVSILQISISAENISDTF
jgi:hypothetical protein